MQTTPAQSVTTLPMRTQLPRAVISALFRPNWPSPAANATCRSDHVELNTCSGERKALYPSVRDGATAAQPSARSSSSRKRPTM